MSAVEELPTRIERIRAIAYSSGSLRDTIHRYKYEGKFGWSQIFARLLIGWLQRHAAEDPPEIIIANPTYREPGSQRLRHTERVPQVAEQEARLLAGHSIQENRPFS